jgi:4'-phosphopantetheinyl transferase EntD
MIELPPGFLDSRIVFRSCALGAFGPDTLHPDEARQLSPDAVEVRRLEFAAGRACARAALRSLGIAGRAVPVAEDRAPVWPEGSVGAISHTRALAAAAVALRSDGIAAIGLDIEEASPLESDLVDTVCGDAERRWLSGRSDGGLLAKAIFCAKEAAYKCQYPLSRTLFGFETLHVELDLADRRFTARFLEDVPGFPAGARMAGSIAVLDGNLVAALFLG